MSLKSRCDLGEITMVLAPRAGPLPTEQQPEHRRGWVSAVIQVQRRCGEHIPLADVCFTRVSCHHSSRQPAADRHCSRCEVSNRHDRSSHSGQAPGVATRGVRIPDRKGSARFAPALRALRMPARRRSRAGENARIAASGAEIEGLLQHGITVPFCVDPVAAIAGEKDERMPRSTRRSATG